MPIEFACPTCLVLLRVSEDKAGEVSNCPQCNSTLKVPNPKKSVPEGILVNRPTATKEEIEEYRPIHIPVYSENSTSNRSRTGLLAAMIVLVFALIGGGIIWLGLRHNGKTAVAQKTKSNAERRSESSSSRSGESVRKPESTRTDEAIRRAQEDRDALNEKIKLLEQYHKSEIAEIEAKHQAELEKLASKAPSEKEKPKSVDRDDVPKTKPQPKATDLQLAALLEDLRSNRDQKRLEALDSIAKFGSEAKTLGDGVVRYGIMHPNRKIRESALATFEKIDPEASTLLVTIMTDSNRYNREEAIKRLGKLQNKSVLPYLKSQYLAEIKNSDGLWASLLESLIEIDCDDEFVLKLVVGIISNPTPTDRFGNDIYGTQLRKLALDHLEQLNISTEKKVAALVAGLRNPDNRIQAIQILGKFGDKASTAIPTLNKLKFDPEMNIRNAARDALQRIGN